ncbi:hypothetical protein [Hymenobacter persicinus]|uniref:Uncharacterized protein n=1 Tax=Hymenobacter persicinus TaxID=2025506 RepID=A0A4Q5LCM3_9BACT|nr:hypothetical protein [Hymenobacter persicinus]RYU79301.1 hypothetical protein EWM57_11195 [Hymenobacter persicinus]
MRIAPLLTTGLLLLLLLVSACNCNNKICDCFSEGEDLVQFTFDTDSLQTGFRKAEINSAYVVRYRAPGFATPLDTVRQRSGPDRMPQFYQFGYAALTLNALFAPRPDQPGAPFTAYSYRIVVPAANRRYDVTELELAGETRGSRCCQCYRNTRKSLRLDGTYLAAEGPDRLLPLVLRR